ncbi:hypothetical protein L218DRAFT_946915 [Marasmius fiardii PR-910]|nr:hypothetical protein L218DRAFT_946915 [Marasmius fiardii PR-910]
MNLETSPNENADQTWGQTIRSAVDLNRAIKGTSSLFSGKGVSETMEMVNGTAQVTQTREPTTPFPPESPGCEFDGEVQYDLSDLLPKLIEKGDISGYGDNQAQQTLVDPQVRNVREIPAGEFEVEDELLERVAAIWKQNFLHSDVRVEPYKIHIYGKGGHFKAHRDTPEAGLVGTFLLGLADTTDEKNFRIGNKKLSASACNWVAFYPDVPHAVTRVRRGGRAVIAFKVFSTGEGPPPDIVAANLLSTYVDEAFSLLDSLELPFGVILKHEYPIGTDGTGVVGFDAVLIAAAKQIPDATIQIIPIVVDVTEKSRSTYDFNSNQKIEAKVYPFTRHHVDLFLGRNTKAARKNVSWLDEVEDVSFYSCDFGREDSPALWWKYRADVTHLGNEYDFSRETSIYLSLVHSSWRFYAQSLLFKTLSFPREEEVTIDDRLGCYVQNVTVDLFKLRLPNYSLDILQKLPNITSFHFSNIRFNFANIRGIIRPSLTSICISNSIIPLLPEQLFFSISLPSTLRSLQFDDVLFRPSIFASLAHLPFPPPHSIRLTHLALNQVRPLSLFNSFFSASHCPFDVQSLNSLHISCPYTHWVDQTDIDIAPHLQSLPILLRSTGSHLTILRLEIRPVQNWENSSFHLLSYTPNLKSLTLFDTYASKSDTTLNWICNLFPSEGLSTLEQFSVEIRGRKLPLSQYATVVSLVSSSSNFPSLWRIFFGFGFVTSKVDRDTLAADLSSGVLGGDKRLVATVVDHDNFYSGMFYSGAAIEARKEDQLEASWLWESGVSFSAR